MTETKDILSCFHIYSCDLYLLELSKSVFKKKYRENRRVYPNGMGLTQEISFNICAHFDPLTCYQDHTQNV